MTAKSYPVQRHVPVTFNTEVPPPPPPGIQGWQRQKKGIVMSKNGTNDVLYMLIIITNAFIMKRHCRQKVSVYMLSVVV